jgi:hypothetical protein
MKFKQNYGLILHRKIAVLRPDERARADAALKELEDLQVIHIDDGQPAGKFFVLAYEDQFTHNALCMYASEVQNYATGSDLRHDTVQAWLEYSADIWAESVIARKMGKHPPVC